MIEFRRNEHDLTVIVAGRSAAKARTFAGPFGRVAELDVAGDLDGPIGRLKPDILVHTCGPFRTRATAWRRPRSATACTVSISPTAAPSSPA